MLHLSSGILSGYILDIQIVGLQRTFSFIVIIKQFMRSVFNAAEYRILQYLVYSHVSFLMKVNSLE